MLRLCVTVPDADTLARVVGGSSPPGLRWGKPNFHLLRETWFDTSDGVLADAGLRLCVRLDAKGERTLELTEVEPVAPGGVSGGRVTSLPLHTHGFYEVLFGQSEVAQRVRSLVEPAGLRPRLALDIDREVREVRQGWLGKPVCTLCFDEILVHESGSTTTLSRIVALGLESARDCLDRTAEHLARSYGLIAGSWEPFPRSLIGRSADPEAGATAPSDSTVALLLVRGGALGLAQGPDGLTVPSTPGSGEGTAAALAAGLTGSASSVDLVGSGDPGDGPTHAETWLATTGRAATALAPELVWVPVAELMERVGTPDLRDPLLASSLAQLARSQAGQALLAASCQGRGEATPLPARPRRDAVPQGDCPGDFLDAELSILAFNQRVLELAEDPTVPLLERMRFLSIFLSNMDEFFVVRVGRLKDRREGSGEGDSLDLSPRTLLDLIAARTRALAARHHACLRGMLLPALADRGVRVLEWRDLDEEDRATLSARFRAEIFPLLTPQALTVSPGQPFPRLETLKRCLAAVVRRAPDAPADLAHIPLPAGVPDFLTLRDGHDLVALEEVIAAHGGAVFPGTPVEGIYPFRITRGGDVAIDEEGSTSLLDVVEDGVEERAYKPVVRVEVHRAMPREARAHLLRGLRQERGSESTALGAEDVFEVDDLPDLAALVRCVEPLLDGESYPPFQPRRPIGDVPSIFEVLARGDHLVHHPFESFDDTVGRFLRDAATDPQVVSIRLALYRTGRQSVLADTLLEALRNGKDVAVFVELKARFDEESNILWTRRLIEAGGHVVYGVVGFKTHAKVALVVRREGDGFRRYVHVGTGNYNPVTSRFYTDLGLLSADPELGADVQDFFNELTGSPGPPVMAYRKLLVAPNGLPQGLEAMIQREVEHARAGRPARIQAKLNGLTDRILVRALYAASLEGVEVDLLVRSACTLRPGVPGLSPTIRVRSILGRFLEHARIYFFENGGDHAYFIASADWRRRNLRKRVEVAAPVEAPEGRARLRAILDAELADPRAWVLQPDGSYQRLSSEGLPAQEVFLAASIESATAPA